MKKCKCIKRKLEKITIYELICRMKTEKINYTVVYENEMYLYDWQNQDYMMDRLPIYLFDVVRKDHKEWLDEKVLIID